MPKGKTHEKIVILLIPYILIILYVVSSFFSVSKIVFVFLGIVIFYFGGIYFSPDLDTKSNVYYRWKILRHIWNPYIFLFKHRSIYTHGIIIGTIIRIIYISFPVITITCCIWILVLHLSLEEYLAYILTLMSDYNYYILEIIIVLEISSLTHTVPDIILTMLKKHRKVTFTILYVMCLLLSVIILIHLDLLKLY